MVRVLVVIASCLAAVRTVTKTTLYLDFGTKRTVVPDVSGYVVFKHIGRTKGTLDSFELGFDPTVYGSLVSGQIVALVRGVVALVTLKLWFCFLVDASSMKTKTHSSSECVRTLIALECCFLVGVVFLASEVVL